MEIERSISPEQRQQLEECREAIAALEQKYGPELVATAWETRMTTEVVTPNDQEIVTDRGLTTDEAVDNLNSARVSIETAPELNTELCRLQEILQRADLPIFLEVHLNAGDTLLGTKLDTRNRNSSKYNVGFNGIMINPFEIDQDLAHYIYACAIHHRNKLDQEQNKNPATLSVVVMRNLGPSGSTLIQFNFQYTRRDQDGRLGDNACALYLTPAEGEEVLSIIRNNNPNTALDMILHHIDPALIEDQDGQSALSPHQNFTSLNLGELSLPATITIPKQGIFGREVKRAPESLEDYKRLIIGQTMTRTEKITFK